MSSDYILETRGVSKSFNGFLAVNDVSLKVRKGHVHALIGPNGAGKTTMFNLLTRFLDPTGGTILLRGVDITRMKPAATAVLGLVRSFQISSVFPEMTVLQNIRMAVQRRRHGVSMDFWASNRKLARYDEEAMHFAERVSLGDVAHKAVSTLSYGRRRVLEIGTTLALDPEVILLDEPMAGVGREDIDHIAELVRALAPAKTVVMVEHNISVVASISDHVTVLARGSVLADGTYVDVAANRQVMEAYTGTDLSEMEGGSPVGGRPAGGGPT